MRWLVLRELREALEDLARVAVARELLLRWVRERGDRLSRSALARAARELDALELATLFLKRRVLELAREAGDPHIYRVLDELGLGTDPPPPVRVRGRTLRFALRVARRVLGDADPLRVLYRLRAGAG